MYTRNVQIRGVVELYEIQNKIQTTNEYSLVLRITHINQVEIETTAQAFAEFKKVLPIICVGDICINNAFINANSTSNMPFLMLANYADFHIGRNLKMPLDKLSLSLAKAKVGLQLHFSVSPNDFELVVATDNTERTKQINAHDGKLIVHAAPSVGKDRDAILTFIPNEISQDFIQGVTREIFGNDFRLRNANNQYIPFHVNVAQMSCMNKLLSASIQSEPEQDEERRVRPGM